MLYFPKCLEEKKTPFPVILHQILTKEELGHIISWLPHGRSWCILDRSQFERNVIPIYFDHGRYASFMRQVNYWGFSRVNKGPDVESYYHEFFLRGLPHLCLKMKRPEKLNKSHSDKQKLPNLYNTISLPVAKTKNAPQKAEQSKPFQESVDSVIRKHDTDLSAIFFDRMDFSDINHTNDTFQPHSIMKKSGSSCDTKEVASSTLVTQQNEHMWHHDESCFKNHQRNRVQELLTPHSASNCKNNLSDDTSSSPAYDHLNRNILEKQTKLFNFKNNVPIVPSNTIQDEITKLKQAISVSELQNDILRLQIWQHSCTK